MKRVSELGMSVLAHGKGAEVEAHVPVTANNREGLLSQICPEVEEIVACADKHAEVCKGMRPSMAPLVNMCMPQTDTSSWTWAPDTDTSSGTWTTTMHAPTQPHPLPHPLLLPLPLPLPPQQPPPPQCTHPHNPS